MKSILLLYLLFTNILFASHDGYIQVYIPIANPQAGILEEEGIELKKVLFFTYFSTPEASVDSVTWSYQANTPHKRYKNRETNLAHIKGLKVTLTYPKNSSCEVIIDSSDILPKERGKKLDKVLNYVEKATKLNMKEANLGCKLTIIKAPKITLKFHPKALDLSHANLKTFEKYKSNYAQAYFVKDKFYPLGYSLDGKFAYIVEHDTDPADFLHIETFIQDLITDKILWSDSFRVENNSGNIDFKTFWKKKQTEIEQQLTVNGIYPSDIQIKIGTHTYKNDIFTLSSKITTRYAKDWASNFVTSSTLYIHSEKRGSKHINKKIYKDNSHLLAREPMAFLATNRGIKRVAILVGAVSRGWEGPPHNLTYEVIGANLSLGFK